MADASHYVIRGGLEGRERLRVIARVLQPSTTTLFDRLNIRGPLACLDVGCGGGDVTMELARRVGSGGRVVGVDIDAEKLAIARAEATEQGLSSVEFHLSDVRKESGKPEFDVVYSRFLLTHLDDPAATVSALRGRLRTGGVLIVEDIDFSGYFTHPECEAFFRYCALYCATVFRRGGDPNIGPRLPSLLQGSGLEDVDVSVVQPVGLRGDVKLITPLTMENIAGAVLEDGLATREEIEDLVRELYAFAADPHALAGTPRIVQTWGRRGAD